VRTVGRSLTEPVVVITRPHVHVHDADLSRRERDSLVLTAEERRWGRRRVTTQAGRTLALALPTGSMLTPGDILHVAIDWYVVIEAAPEAVLAVTPRSRDEALRIAYEVGNRHFTLALDGERLLLPDDTAMEQLLGRLDVPVERVQSIFVLLRAGDRHDHDHCRAAGAAPAGRRGRPGGRLRPFLRPGNLRSGGARKVPRGAGGLRDRAPR